MRRILISAGGTGGHIFPALSVAREFRKRDVNIHWIGVKDGLEESLVAKEFSLSLIRVKPLRNQKALKTVWAPFRLIGALYQSLQIIRKIKPNLVVGFGGYVSGPCGLAAWILRVPLVIHEQNSILGFTNRCLSFFARASLQAFPNTFPERTDAITTGNPVRSELLALSPPRDRFLSHKGPLRILILGGSQGASAINHTVLEALTRCDFKNELSIWHQTGPRDFESAKKSYEQLSLDARVSAFIDKIDSAYDWADLVIGRAGALTVSELADIGIGSILIPYPYAVDDHQKYNARFLENVGAAIVIEQDALNREKLIQLFKQFVNDRNTLLMMAESAKRLSSPKAIHGIIEVCEMAINFEK